MPDEFDSLILEASVFDDFSKTLNELASHLAEIAVLEKQVFPIDGDVDIAQAMAELETLEAKLKSIDRQDVDVDVDVDDASAQAAAGMSMLFSDDPGFLLGGGGGGGGGMSFNRRKRSLLEGNRDIDLSPLDTLSSGVAASIRATDIPGGRKRGPLEDAMADFTSLKLSMGILMNLLASLVPLLGVFVGALPAAIAGVGALAAGAIAAAGALAAIAGLGLGAMMFQGGQLNVEELQRKLRELLDTALESFEPLMEALRPVAEGMLDSAAFAIRDLAAHMRVLTNFSDEAQAFFQWFANIIGPLVQETIMFAEAMAPVMSLIAGGIGDIDWFGIFASVIADTMPLLVTFTGLLMNMLPGIYELSLGFFRVANAVMAVFSGIFSLVDILGPLAPILGSFIALVLTSITVTSLWSMATGYLAARVGNLVKQLFLYMTQAIMNITANLGLGQSFYFAAAAAATLMGVLSFGLAPVISGIVGHFTGMQNSIGGATDELRRFSQQSNRVSGMGLGVGSGQGYGAGGGPAYQSVNNITVEAPDKETGNAAAHTLQFQQSTATTDGSNVDSSHHSE